MKHVKIITAGAITAVAIVALMIGLTFVQTSSTVTTITETTGGSASQSSTQSGSSTLSGPTGVLGVSLTDPPVLPPSVTNVFITYSSIQVHLADAGNQSGWYVVATSGSVDLLQVVNVSLTLGSALIVTGVFNLIAFNITSAAVTIDGVNQTAYVPANRIDVPIVGDVSVTQGNSSGVLVDLSPEVVPYQNGTSISYVLVPEAKSLPIPPNVWNVSLEQKGAIIQQIQNQSWVQENPENVVVTGVKITPNTFSITVKNIGKNNASLSSLSIGAVANLDSCTINSTDVAPALPKPLANTTSVSTSTTSVTSTSSSPAPTPVTSSTESSHTSITVSVPQSTYTGQQKVIISGNVTPPPSTSSAAVSILVSNPSGLEIEATNEPIQPSGAFSSTLTAGVSANAANLWIAGLYTITVGFGGATARTTFYWTPQSSASTTSTTSVSTSSTGPTPTPITSSTHTTKTTETTHSTKSSTTNTPPTITVATNGSSFFGISKVMVDGSISPLSASADAQVVIRVVNPQNQIVYSNYAPVNSSGLFGITFVAGALPTALQGQVWINGTYTVYASRGSLSAQTSFTWNGPAPITTHTTVTTSTKPDPNPIQDYICGLYSAQSSQLYTAFPIAYYQVLANGTLLPINYTEIILDATGHGTVSSAPGASITSEPPTNLSYTLMPNQTATFTYTGTINTVSSSILSYIPKTFAVPSSLFGITPGQVYAVVGAGTNTRIVTLVNATAS